MKLSVYCTINECESLESQECLTQFKAELAEWLSTADAKHQPLNEDDRIGIYTSARKSKQLQTPLNFLYNVAKNNKVEFAIAMMDDDNGDTEWQEVCFFGYEEGQPDIFEIGCYLGFD